MAYFETKSLSVGYNGKVLIHDIDLQLEKGRVLTLIGPNGAGKSTILKSITRQLETISGTVLLEKNDIRTLKAKDFAKKTAVVLTDRIRPELMTCAQVAAMGRYPYTGMFGKLTEEDKRIVEESLARVHALDLAERDFDTLSDGQRQRVLLARAICQKPEVIILDEPTAYLDIRHKTELLDILLDMAENEQITVIMSLHEIDLAMKASDFIVCVKGDTIAAAGSPADLMQEGSIEALYDMKKGSYNMLMGSVELAKPQGVPQVFVLCGAGTGIPCFRALQKKRIPFACGILSENDIDYPVATALAQTVIAEKAFYPVSEETYEKAARALLSCSSVWNAGVPKGPLNTWADRLLALAEERGIPMYDEAKRS